VRKSLQSKSSKDISSPAEDRDATPRDSLADHPKFVPSDLSQSQIIEGVSTDAITETYTTPFAPAVEENVDDGCYGAVVHLKGMSHLLPISEVLANALTYTHSDCSMDGTCSDICKFNKDTAAKLSRPDLVQIWL
jgi:hypothetical protein